ncbi:hypothetical protein V8G54_033214 [Vigna mungo]|uniref:DUF7794 domain-containing protein n=1 Tax=Vigna mungo TaxID=3915 RepID=A0AAQ3MMU4_VIGMU
MAKSAIGCFIIARNNKHVAEVEPLDLSIFLSTMDVFLIVSLFSPQIKVSFSFSVFSSIWQARTHSMAGEASGSLTFVDSSSHQFLRARSSNDEQPSFLLQDVSAVVSVLLGFAPPSTLSAASSSKLNKVLSPNPFKRPRAVFLLEVNGINGLGKIAQDSPMFSNSFWSINSDKVDIQLPDESDVSVVSLDDQLEHWTDKEIRDFSSLIDGSYVPDAFVPLNGVLSVPLANGASVSFRMSEKAERMFVFGLMSLMHDVKRAIQLHDDLSQTTKSPAELLMGCFNGIKVLQEQYETESIAEHGIEVLYATLSKIVSSLQEAYKEELEKKFDVIFTPHHTARWLAETSALNATLPEVVLVRRTLAWVTGILLLVSTLMGICYLLNMPLTRDTLLYSNVKLD